MFFLLLFSGILSFQVSAQVSNLVPRSPVDLQELEEEENIPLQVDLKSIPDFPKSINVENSKRRILVQDDNLSLDLRLKISLDSTLSTKSSKVGDYFKAHVIEDFYFPTKVPKLIVPRGSYLRGRVNLVRKPNILKKTGEISIFLDELVTPLGEIIPLAAMLDIQQGILSESGLFEQVSIGEESKANKLINQLMRQKNTQVEITKPVLVLKMLDVSIVGSLIEGNVVALTSSPLETNILSRGQELQLVLKREIQIKS